MTRSHRWTEEDAPPRLDLRLVMPAVGVWGGCAAGIAVSPAGMSDSIRLSAIVVATMAAPALAAHSMIRRGPRAAAVARAALAMLSCTGAAMIIAVVHWGGAAEDPLATAAAQQDWVRVTVVVTADPVAVAPSWPAADAANGGAGQHSTRWRLHGRADRLDARGIGSRSRADVTVFAAGDAWGRVRDGQTLIVRGSASPDQFSTWPAVRVRAQGDPEVIADPPWWSAWAGHARQALVHSAAELGVDRGGLLRGLVVGDTRGIDDALDLDAKITGLTHLVSVSGAHVAVIGGAVLVLLRRFGPRVTAVGVSVTLLAMVVLVGPQPSVLRAVAMGAVGVLAGVMGRARTALSALAAGVMALLLVDPRLACNIGFMLSVQATAGLILLAPRLSRAMQRRGVPPGWATMLAMAVAAHICTMPVIAAISGTVSLAAIPANIAVAPVVAPALLIGLLCLVVGPWWPDCAEVLAHLDGPLLGWICGVAHRFAAWKWAALSWSSSVIGVIGLIGAVVVLIVLIASRVTRMMTFAVAAGVVAALAITGAVPVGWPAPGWMLTMCDVGQGDGIVLATDQPGEAVVVDTGPDPDLMDACLARLGIETIALMVVTHLHADHVGGIEGAARSRRVRAIGVGPDRSAPGALAAISGVADGAPVRVLTAGSRWDEAGLTIDVLGPSREYHGTDSDPNNDSIVLRATRHGVRVLLTGDTERPAQQSLLDRGVDLAADVLKQPHHGSSKLLPAFVAAVGARVAVIGVGAGNDYGHPAATALRADRASGITTILRTDTDGDIQIVVTGDGLATVRRGTSRRAHAAAAGASTVPPVGPPW